ncbi:MAG: hypothetical protein EPO42_00645 [Gallionellaceae bacterium]|nr:MAG: hypothetical protein EPO42_00645 [Gallionellaceae bacterium]
MTVFVLHRCATPQHGEKRRRFMFRYFWFATLVLLMFSAGSVMADESGWRTSWDGTLYGYANSMSVREDSVLNPGNRMAKLSQRGDYLEARFNIKAEDETWRFTERPIMRVQQQSNAFGSENKSEAYLSQWQVRWKADETLALSGGRELLNWGPAQFRSPSNPFYFNNGRSNPVGELSGMDALRLSWSPEVSTSVYVARIVGSGHGHADPDPWANGWLVKADWRGEESAVGMALAQRERQALFVGAHGQRTLGEAWLLYGELGSSTRMGALSSPADANLPFAIEAESARRTDVLLGTAYTFESGHSLSAEYLRYGHGYDAAENRAYFARAAAAASIFPTGAAIPTLASALTSAPALLGRDYLHLLWQSSPMESAGYARLMLTHNLTDRSSELSGYGEYMVDTHLSTFAYISLASGGAQREFARLFEQMFTLGVKVALP